MKINRVNYYFKFRDIEDIVYQIKAIYEDLAYNEIDKNKVLNAYNITDRCDLKIFNIEKSVQMVTETNQEVINIKCEFLQKQWNNYSDTYFQSLEDVLNIKINKEYISNYYCYLHYLPINEIDLNTNKIYLDCTCDEDELFKNFIIMLTKVMVANIWQNQNKYVIDVEFDAKNKLWLFIDIAIDAIFANSSLKQICQFPSYKYFYSIKVDGVNIMEEFRKLFSKISLDDFFNEVYSFVYEYYKDILKFKNYLY